MLSVRNIAALGLCVLLLAGCDRKPKQPAPAAGAPSSGSFFGSDCPQPPSKTAVLRTLQAAMVAIYGVDEGPAQFVISTITPTDCKHLAAIYRAGATDSAHTAPLIYADDEKWYLALYGKSYPVQ